MKLPNQYTTEELINWWNLLRYSKTHSPLPNAVTQ